MMESTNKQFFISLRPGSALARSVRFGQHPKLHLTRVTTEGVDQCLTKHSERQIHSFAQSTIANPNHEHSYLFVCFGFNTISSVDRLFVRPSHSTPPFKCCSSAVTEHRAGVQFVASGKPNA
jgi:hypothetical protein